MRPPCEEIFKDVLPTIRAILVKDLVERHKLNQVEVAKRLGVTQPAVSQYLSMVRGAGHAKVFLKRSKFMKSMKSLSDAIAKGEMAGSKLTEMCCKLCAMVRKEK